MKAEALEALQSVRTLLAYQLTPEAVSELLEPIQRVLDGKGNILEHLSLAIPYIDGHNARVESAVNELWNCQEQDRNPSDELIASVRSLRL